MHALHVYDYMTFKNSRKIISSLLSSTYHDRTSCMQYAVFSMHIDKESSCTEYSDLLYRCIYCMGVLVAMWHYRMFLSCAGATRTAVPLHVLSSVRQNRSCHQLLSACALATWSWSDCSQCDVRHVKSQLLYWMCCIHQARSGQFSRHHVIYYECLVQVQVLLPVVHCTRWSISCVSRYVWYKVVQ